MVNSLASNIPFRFRRNISQVALSQPIIKATMPNPKDHCAKENIIKEIITCYDIYWSSISAVHLLKAGQIFQSALLLIRI